MTNTKSRLEDALKNVEKALEVQQKNREEIKQIDEEGNKTLFTCLLNARQELEWAIQDIKNLY